jgi:energy-converting hydrogenase Eha subunit F
MSENHVPEDDAQREQTPVWQTLIGVAVLLALLVAAALAVAQIYPNKLPARRIRAL